jgi:hypothetical protein
LYSSINWQISAVERRTPAGKIRRRGGDIADHYQGPEARSAGKAAAPQSFMLTGSDLNFG